MIRFDFQKRQQAGSFMIIPGGLAKIGAGLLTVFSLPGVLKDRRTIDEILPVIILNLYLCCEKRIAVRSARNALCFIK